MKKYVFKPYNPIFLELFNIEKERLTKFLTGNYQIEHIGSTAIPGLGGKGIIDIMIAVPKDKMKDYSAQLEKAGYEYVEQPNVEQRLFHWQDLPDTMETFRRYHIHLTYPEGTDWKNALAFRDYLRTHPADLEKYAEVKQKATLEADEDTETYMRIKESILKEILNKALNS